jgi:hypothetical protein
VPPSFILDLGMKVARDLDVMVQIMADIWRKAKRMGGEYKLTSFDHFELS